MKISLKVEYSCRVLAQLARWSGRNELPHIESLAEIEKIPANYLVQILNDLRAGGLVVSRRGKQGGYALSRPAAEISLYDIIKAMDGELLGFTERPKGASGKNVARVWDEVIRLFEEKTKATNLDHFLQAEGNAMWHI
ncbi:MAG: Rrf2 family transcriptional regulator [Verrucomicrobiota bacterium]|nr:Rrf2 family transcriptional regulator [Verrucomicrobiota bacterium]